MFRLTWEIQFKEIYIYKLGRHRISFLYNSIKETYIRVLSFFNLWKLLFIYFFFLVLAFNYAYFRDMQIAWYVCLVQGR